MYFSDLDKVRYPVGTFKLGQKIYHIMDKKHRFKFHKKCEYYSIYYKDFQKAISKLKENEK